MYARVRAFTLIELLVVITIIVVLLALLTPALDKAIYQAELAVCGANQKVLGSGVMSYAMEHKRWYPYRSGVHTSSAANNPWYLPFALSHPANQENHDDRPELRPYMNITGVFSDPLTEEAAYGEVSDSNYIWTPTNMWFGFKFASEGSGMLRSGQRLTWTNNGTLDRPEKLRVLASDSYMQDYTQWVAGHPDSNGVLWNYHREDADIGVAGNAGFLDTDGRATVSYWVSQTAKPGNFDFNSVFDDGSVSRLLDVTPEEWEVGDRVARVGVSHIDASSDGRWMYIARR